MNKTKMPLITIMIILLCSTSIKVSASSNNYGNDLSSAYSYIGTELNNKLNCIDIEVADFDEGDISELISTDGLQTYNPTGIANFDYEFYNLKTLRYSKYVTDIMTSNGKTSGFKIRLFPTYRESKEESEYVYNKVEEILASNSEISNYSEADQYKWIYDYIITQISYDYSYTNQTAYDALTKGTTICGGYASLYYAFATKLGLPCRIAYGKVDGNYHSWNLVRLDGQWYYVDATMGDSSGNRDNYLFRAMNNVVSYDIEDGFLTAFNFATVDYAIN